MKEGDEQELALKHYIHRHLQLPPTLHESMARSDAVEILKQFAFHYVNSLLLYCSDDLKESMCVLARSQLPSCMMCILIPNPATHRLLHHVRENDYPVQDDPAGKGKFFA